MPIELHLLHIHDEYQHKCQCVGWYASPLRRTRNAGLQFINRLSVIDWSEVEFEIIEFLILFIFFRLVMWVRQLSVWSLPHGFSDARLDFKRVVKPHVVFHLVLLSVLPSCRQCLEMSIGFYGPWKCNET